MLAASLCPQPRRPLPAGWRAGGPLTRRGLLRAGLACRHPRSTAGYAAAAEPPPEPLPLPPQQVSRLLESGPANRAPRLAAALG